MLPLSIGDGELCETALTTVSVPEMFRYWLQGGRITIGFLGGAQIDRFANLNTTVVGPYDKPKVRLPGGGGAPEIATCCGEIFIIMAQGKRSFVEKLDFVTSLGHGDGRRQPRQARRQDQGPDQADHRSLRCSSPIPRRKEMTVVSLHPGVTREQIAGEHRLDGRTLRRQVAETPPPTARELEVLRDLHARTDRAHIARQRDGNDVTPFICDAVRTPIGRYGGALAEGAHRRSRRRADQGADGAQPEGRLGEARRGLSSAAPTRPARTTATSRAWRCCWPACRPACPA